MIFWSIKNITKIFCSFDLNSSRFNLLEEILFIEWCIEIFALNYRSCAKCVTNYLRAKTKLEILRSRRRSRLLCLFLAKNTCIEWKLWRKKPSAGKKAWLTEFSRAHLCHTSVLPIAAPKIVALYFVLWLRIRIASDVAPCHPTSFSATVRPAVRVRVHYRGWKRSIHVTHCL